MESEASLNERDYFSDYSLLPDPYSYFEAVRAKGPVAFIGDPPVLFVTGFEEAVSVLKDTEHFSSLRARRSMCRAS